LFWQEEEDLGSPKASVIAARLKEINPYVNVRGIVGSWRDVDVNGYDLVFDCMDAWAEKKALMAMRHGVLVLGSVGEDIGFVSVLKEKMFPVKRIRGTCTRRVLGARVGVVGSIMASEGIRELNGDSSPLRDKLLHIDLRPNLLHGSGRNRQVGGSNPSPRTHFLCSDDFPPCWTSLGLIAAEYIRSACCCCSERLIVRDHDYLLE